MKFPWHRSLFPILHLFFILNCTAVDSIKTNQSQTSEGDSKSLLSGTQFATDCPHGSFHHPVTGVCIYCDCVKDSVTTSSESKEYYQSNCGDLVNKCNRKFQFYDENRLFCSNCSEICGEEKDPHVCQRNCPKDRCCSDTEVYSPHFGSCESCSVICNDDKNEAYCIKNCKNYRKDNPPESSTRLTQTPETTTSSVSNPSTVIIAVVAVILTVAIIIALICCLKRIYELRKRRRRQRDNERQIDQELQGTEMIDLHLDRAQDLQERVGQPDDQNNDVEEQVALKKSIEESQIQQSHSGGSNSAHKYPEVEERPQLNSSNQQWEDETSLMKLPDDFE